MVSRTFLKVLLDHLEFGLYISTNNPAFEPVYTDCISWDLCPNDGANPIDIERFSNMTVKMLNGLIQ